MADSNKDLLNLENKNSSSSTIESKLFVCKKNEFRQTQNPKPKPPDGMPFTSSVPKSQVLGKAKDFLGVFSKANRRLLDDAKDNAKDYDIEALTGNESEYIEMDLMLGVADLHTPEAVAAAESAIAGYQPVISLALSSSSSSDDESSDDDEGSDDDDDDDGDDGDHLACSPTKIKRSKPLEGDNSSEPSGYDKSKKRPKIVELS
ncbi:uncharacterized protein LOC131301511 [Rhododendron vialii]|uniref:uncharacterized protein LOC131301511 n=1 Tax=Rhododendron vialii TaxID=182163 RepID=UPI00265E3080|nr:uncharacterized protein LOC131301511 [Rhododendron vialii]XP_058183840.1 uncharacterized protein LOC131301511 [Rhododendron vialii]XP_058183841.1 uncharacterized protein LOC131301511 [Rhododendron vialii]XP_058183842.1 uncharacterized protein LOC131301511 [Rhododendron vialii]